MAKSVAKQFSDIVNVIINDTVSNSGHAHIPKILPDTNSVLNVVEISNDGIIIIISTAILILGSTWTAATLSKLKYFDKILLITKILLKTTIGYVISLFLVPVLCFTYIFFWIYSHFVDFYVRATVSKSMIRAGSLDAIWVNNTPESRAFVYGSFKVEGTPDLEKLKEHFNKRIIMAKSISGSIQFPKLRQIICRHAEYYYWKDDENFDISNHIKTKNISDIYPDLISQEGISGQDMVCRYLADYGLDQVSGGNVSQWDVLCLVTGPNEFFYVIRCDHGIGDGLSLVRLLLEYLNDEPIKGRNICPLPSLFSRIAIAIWSIAYLPFAFYLVLNKGTCNPLHGPKFLGRKHYIAGSAIPYNIIREIKIRSKTTVHSVLFSAISTSIGKNLHKKSYNGSQFSVFFPLGFHDPTTELRLENTFVIGIAPLPLPTVKSIERPYNPEEPPLSTLHNMHQALLKLNYGATLMACYYLMLVFIKIVPLALSKFLYNSRGLTLVTSNVPGPAKPLTVIGQKVTEMRFWVPDRHPLGISVTFVTNDGFLRPNLRIEEGLVNSKEEAEELMQDMVDEIKRMAEVLNIKTSDIC